MTAAAPSIPEAAEILRRLELRLRQLREEVDQLTKLATQILPVLATTKAHRVSDLTRQKRREHLRAITARRIAEGRNGRPSRITPERAARLAELEALTPPPVAEAIRRELNKLPGQRFETVEEMRRTLRTFRRSRARIAGLSSPATVAPPVAPPPAEELEARGPMPEPPAPPKPKPKPKPRPKPAERAAEDAAEIGAEPSPATVAPPVTPTPPPAPSPATVAPPVIGRAMSIAEAEREAEAEAEEALAAGQPVRAVAAVTGLELHRVQAIAWRLRAAPTSPA